MSQLINNLYSVLWDDIICIPACDIKFSFLTILLVFAGLYFSFKSKFLLFSAFPDICRTVKYNAASSQKNKKSISATQALIVSTATRVGMGNLIGVAAAISAGGAGSIFWMWLTAILGTSTAFIESTLAQLYKQPDPLYGGYRGGPAYYIHKLATKNIKLKRSLAAILFSVSALICWCGISQVIGNSVSSSFNDIFHIPTLYTSIFLLICATIIVMRKNSTVKFLDIIVPIMASAYILMTIYIMTKNLFRIPHVFSEIFSQAFGFRQVVSGGFGAVLMNGVKRGLFSNEAGSGSAPCSAAAAESKNIVDVGFLQVFGVLVDTIICSCTALIILLTPETLISNLNGIELIQKVMQYHFGELGLIFISVILFLFSFSTFIGILFYSRSNVAYLFGDNWLSQNMFKILALAMLFIGGIASYSIVWTLADVGVGLMTIINLIAIFPLSKQALQVLNEHKKESAT